MLNARALYSHDRAMRENGELVERHVFKVSMGGLLELLSGALYTSESVFVRELIQNGVDAVAARRGIEPEYRACPSPVFSWGRRPWAAGGGR